MVAADLHPDLHANADLDAHTDSHADDDTDAHSDTHADRDADGHADRYSYTDANRHSDFHTDADRDTDGDAKRNANGDTRISHASAAHRFAVARRFALADGQPDMDNCPRFNPCRACASAACSLRVLKRLPLETDELPLVVT